MDKSRIFWMIMVLWTVVVLGFVAVKEYTLRSGREVMLKTVPVDPRDILRGDYVVLRYEISTIKLDNFSIDGKYSQSYSSSGSRGAKEKKMISVKEGDIIMVVLEKNGRYGSEKNAYSISKIYKDNLPQKNDLYIKGKVKRVDSYSGTIDVEYGIESYFVPEGKGKEIERAGGKDVFVRVSVDNSGRSVIKSVKVGGKEFKY